MSKIKVILQSSYGGFDSPDGLSDLVESKGFTHLWDIDARTDNDLITYIENKSENGFFMGDSDWQHLNIVEVDTAKKWTIESYDGKESIKYIDLNIIDKSINYVEFKRQTM